ncbi:MAG: hypothetical protein ACOH5I_02090 [Oligoflexus sp.]
MEGNLKMLHVFEKIGAIGQLFSDERLYELLQVTQPAEVIVDSPLTEPPCVACQRPVCPGVNACDDMGVAMMQSMASTHPKGRHRKRPINPQTQRIWDVLRWLEADHHLQEPSYSANMAPLLVRAKTLQRRLNCLEQPIILKETSVPHSLRVLVKVLGLPQEYADLYRSFELGRFHRSEILEAMFRKGWIALNEADTVESSVENFNAFIAAFMAALFRDDFCVKPQTQFFEQQGWVYLPDQNALSSWRKLNKDVRQD